MTLLDLEVLDLLNGIGYSNGLLLTTTLPEPQCLSLIYKAESSLFWEVPQMMQLGQTTTRKQPKKLKAPGTNATSRNNRKNIDAGDILFWRLE